MKTKESFEDPLVSVCVPVFNGALYIHKCIESILLQEFKSLEILIIDNASTDNTLEICSSFSDPRIRIVRSESNIGSYGNFRKCFKLALAPLILMLPCDDLLEPNCLQILSSPLISNPSIGFSFGRTRRIDSEGSTLFEPCFLKSGLLEYACTLDFIVNNFNPIQHPLVRKSFYFHNNEFSKYYGCFMDIALWIKIAKSSQKVFVATEVTTCIRSYPEQGQAIIADINKNNLNKVADHFGVRSLVQHQYRSNYNLSMLRFIKLVNSLEDAANFSSINVQKLLSKLIANNISTIGSSIYRLRIDRFTLEMKVLFRIFDQIPVVIAIYKYSTESFNYLFNKLNEHMSIFFKIK
jgi:glycosyltransferase involved in cell wall biosynthesis